MWEVYSSKLLSERTINNWFMVVLVLIFTSKHISILYLILLNIYNMTPQISINYFFILWMLVLWDTITLWWRNGLGEKFPCWWTWTIHQCRSETKIMLEIFFPFIFISWRLITLQYCSGFCHTLTWISHGFTCIPHPDPPSYLPLHPIPLGLPTAPQNNRKIQTKSEGLEKNILRKWRPKESRSRNIHIRNFDSL